MSEYGLIAVDVLHPSRGLRLACDVVDVRSRRQATADVEELVDASGGEKTHRSPDEGPVGASLAGQPRSQPLDLFASWRSAAKLSLPPSQWSNSRASLGRPLRGVGSSSGAVIAR